MDFAHIEPARPKEVHQGRLDHGLDELAQALPQVAKAAREAIEQLARLLELAVGLFALDGKLRHQGFDLVPAHLGSRWVHRALSFLMDPSVPG